MHLSNLKAQIKMYQLPSELPSISCFKPADPCTLTTYRCRDVKTALKCGVSKPLLQWIHPFSFQTLQYYMRCISHSVQTLFYCHKFAWKPLNYNTIWRLVGVHWLQFVWNQSKKHAVSITISFQSRSNKSQCGGRSRYSIEHQIFISLTSAAF